MLALGHDYIIFTDMDYNFLAFITNLRGSQLFIIILVVLILFGTKRLPDIARGIGKAIREFRSSASDLEKEIKTSINKTEVANHASQAPQNEVAAATKEKAPTDKIS